MTWRSRFGEDALVVVFVGGEQVRRTETRNQKLGKGRAAPRQGSGQAGRNDKGRERRSSQPPKPRLGHPAGEKQGDGQFGGGTGQNPQPPQIHPEREWLALNGRLRHPANPLNYSCFLGPALSWSIMVSARRRKVSERSSGSGSLLAHSIISWVRPASVPREAM